MPKYIVLSSEGHAEITLRLKCVTVYNYEYASPDEAIRVMIPRQWNESDNLVAPESV